MTNLGLKSMSDLTPLFFIQDWLISVPTAQREVMVVLGLFLVIAGLYAVTLAHRRLAKSSLVRKWSAVLANVASCVLIACLLVDIRKAEDVEAGMTLLTPGYTGISMPENRKVLALKNSLSDEEISSLPEDTTLPESVLDLSSMLTTHPNIDILGDGLSQQQWNDIENFVSSDFAVNWYPSSKRFGLIDITWPRESYVGASNTLSARLQSKKGDETLYEVSLNEPGGLLLDKVVIRSEELFTLDFRPKIEGQWLYSVQVKELTREAVLLEESIAIDVKEAEPLHVLIKQSSPSFETRHLQNWLGQYGHSVTVLTQISREKHLVQRINIEREGGDLADEFLRQGQLSDNLLSTVDFVVIDGRAFSSMDTQQQETLSQAVSDGVGVLIFADNSFEQYLNDKERVKPRLIQGVTLSIHDEDSTQNTAKLMRWLNHQTKLPIKASPYLLSSAHADTLVYDDENRSVLINRSYGQGHIAVSLINESYQWRTMGENDSYSHYWQSALWLIARANHVNYWLPQNHKHLVYVNDSHSVCAMVDYDSNPEMQTDVGSPLTTVMSIQLNQVGLNESFYCAVFWPQIPGWYNLRLMDRNGVLFDRQRVFVNNNKHWQAELQRIRHSATKRMSERFKERVIAQSSRTIEKWPIALLLLSCLTYLWVERKLR